MKTAASVLLVTAIMFIPAVLSGQTKFEREYRIKEKNVPEQAMQFIQNAFGNRKIKWYAEESQDGKSIEAKIKFRKHKYSVEFDTPGNLQDVEKTIELNEIDAETIDEITKSLTLEFGDFKILKIQVQYTSGDLETMKELIISGTSPKPFDRKYEVVLETRDDKAYKAFEVLLTKEGRVEKLLEMDLRGMDNMQF